MEKIGIMGAMDEEISFLLEHMKNVNKKDWNIFTFYTGTLHGKDIVLVKSGVGKVFASMIAQHLIDVHNVTAILFSGVGGGLNPQLDIGDVVVSEDSAHHDIDAQALGFKRGQIAYTDYRFFNAERKLIELAASTKLDKGKVITGRILTGEQFITHENKKDHPHIYEEMQGDCIEMEGAAVAQVCTVNTIPHVIIRTISDKANGDAAEDFNAFKDIVAQNSLKVLENVCKNIDV